MLIYNALLKLAETMNGAKIEGQLAKDILWILGAIMGFWLIVLIILTPYWVLKFIFNRK